MLGGGVLALVAVLVAAAPVLAEPPIGYQPNPNKADTSRAARESAIASIPFEKLSPEAQAKVNSVLQNVTVFRRMPIRVVACDPEMYLFLFHHPDVVVNVWGVLGISQMTMQQTGPDMFQMSDGAGMTGTVEFLYRHFDAHVLYAEGFYEGPLLAKPVRGRALMVVRSGYVLETDGRYYITTRLDTFMQVDPGGAELLTKTLHPLVGNVADVNFTQTVGFVGSLSRTAEVNPRGVQRLAGSLTKVQPEVRGQFAEIAQRVAEKAAQLAESRAGPNAVIAERPGRSQPQ